VLVIGKTSSLQCKSGPSQVFTPPCQNVGMTEHSIIHQTQTLGLQAKQASALMAKAPSAIKIKALKLLASLLRSNIQALQADNNRDIERALAAGLAEPMVDRLRLTPKVIETCAQGCEQLAAMPDVIGEIIGMKQQPSGIRVGQMRVPIGVFGMIFESRPNVTIEAASLSIKSGNACILRGGSEAIASNKALARLVQQALRESGLPEHAVQMVQTTDRSVVDALITMPQYVDVIIPRGGKGLIERISAGAKVPVIKHLDGNCHTYVDDPCDLAMAIKVADNAKTQKYSPCNATESLLVARGVAQSFLPRDGRHFCGQRGRDALLSGVSDFAAEFSTKSDSSAI
jgi:glutamate-5-semialdehyde dehydrogenase